MTPANWFPIFASRTTQEEVRHREEWAVEMTTAVKQLAVLKEQLVGHLADTAGTDDNVTALERQVAQLRGQLAETETAAAARLAAAREQTRMALDRAELTRQREVAAATSNAEAKAMLERLAGEQERAVKAEEARLAAAAAAADMETDLADEATAATSAVIVASATGSRRATSRVGPRDTAPKVAVDEAVILMHSL